MWFAGDNEPRKSELHTPLLHRKAPTLYYRGVEVQTDETAKAVKKPKIIPRMGLSELSITDLLLNAERAR